jgi:hypothetical protein
VVWQLSQAKREYMKVTKQVIESRFKALCDALGKRVATDYKDVGAWSLDYARCYGGFVIVEIMAHGEKHPFGHERVSASELYTMINFALRAIALDRPDQPSHVYWPADKHTPSLEA